MFSDWNVFFIVFFNVGIIVLVNIGMSWFIRFWFLNVLNIMFGRLKVFFWVWKKGGWFWVDKLGVLGFEEVGLVMVVKYN